jgi:hypothetical protein
MDKDSGHTMVHGADSVEHVHRDRPSERETGNAYEKSFEIRFDEIDFIGHLHNTPTWSTARTPATATSSSRVGTCAAWTNTVLARCR